MQPTGGTGKELGQAQAALRRGEAFNGRLDDGSSGKFRFGLPSSKHWGTHNETQASVASPPNALVTSSSSTGATYASLKPSLVSVAKPPLPSTSRTATTPALGPPVQTPRIAAPKNTTVDVVYSDGACRANGTPNAMGGIGVWWGPNDPRC